MKKIKKYKQQKNTNSLASKIASYSALAGAMMAATPGAMAQCGTAGSASPVLDVDINGDGITDVTINWINLNTSLGLFFSNIVPPAQVPIIPPGGTGTLPTPLQFNSVTNFSWANGYALSNSVSATFAPFANSVVGPFPGPYGGPTGGGCYTLLGGGVTAGQAVSFGTYVGSNVANFAGFPSSYLSIIYAVSQGIYYSLDISFAYAQAATGNQIIGLSAAGGNVCSVTSSGGATIGAVPASNFVSLGTNSAVNSSFKTFSFYAFLGGDAYFLQQIPVNGSSCGGAIAPISNVVVNFGYTNIPTYGPFYNLLGSGTGVVSSNQNVNTTTHLAVQFTADTGETHNGWVELSIDPASSEVTCVGTGYQQCSVETAIAVSGDAANACMMVGAATNENPACVEEPPEPPADIPTTGEWGLIILGLMMSITAIVGIRQRREEDAVA